MPSPITCHVLDSSIGKPAVGVKVIIQRANVEGDQVVFQTITRGTTDDDGRCNSLFEADSYPLIEGTYKAIFRVEEYFRTSGKPCFFPTVDITFYVTDIEEHYHIPLLLSPFSYTTYRGR